MEPAGRLQFVDPLDRWGLEWNVAGSPSVAPHGIVESPRAGTTGFALFCPSMGVLIGACAGNQRPRLWSERRAIEPTADGARIETASGSFRLVIRERPDGVHVFRLADVEASEPADDDALDARAALEAALAPYAEFAMRQTGLQPTDDRRVEEAVHRLITGLRSDARNIYLWCAPGSQADEVATIRDIYPLVRAWSAVRPDIARALLSTALIDQQPDGSLPCYPGNSAIAKNDDPVLPYLAKCFQLASRKGMDRTWFDFAAPRIQRYVEHLVARLDPDQEGLPIWPNADDALVPELHEPERVTTDLPALLIREIDALESIANTVAVRSLDLSDLLAYREILLRRMRDFLWSPEQGAFWDRYRDARPILRKSLSSVAPILIAGLTEAERNSVMTALMSKEQFLSDTGIRSWVPWPEDEMAPPVAPLVQLLMLEALDAARASAEAAALRAAIASDRFPLDSATRIALCIDTLALPPDAALNIQGLSPLLTLLDRHRMAVFASLAVAFILFNALVFVWVSNRPTIAPQTLETHVGLARRYYQEGRYAEALRLMQEILATPQRHESAFLEMGNIHYRMGNWAEAEAAYRAQQGAPQWVARARHNLAVLLNEQHRQEEAIALWREIADTYASAAPDVASRARTALRLLGAAEPDRPVE